MTKLTPAELKREARKFQKWRAKKLAEERAERGPDVYEALVERPEPQAPTRERTPRQEAYAKNMGAYRSVGHLSYKRSSFV